MRRAARLAVLFAAGSCLAPGQHDADVLVERCSEWELIGKGYQLTSDSAVDPEGVVYFTDARRNRITKIDLDGKISLWREDSHGSHSVTFGVDGRLYAGQHDRKRIVAFSMDGTETVIAEGMQSHHIAAARSGILYACEAPLHRSGWWMV